MKKRGEKGVTLIALAITIAVLAILGFSITANLDGLKDTKNKTNFEEDMYKLSEKVEQYYARYNRIPVLNEYKNTSMFINDKNINDSSTYWVLDVARLGITSLNYGLDYAPIKKLEDTTADVSQYTDVYIVNKASHTIYYPEGVEYDGKINYTLKNNYSNVNVTTTASIEFSGETTQTTTPTIQAEVKHISYTDIVLEECRWILSTQSEPIGTEKEKYTNSFLQEQQTIDLSMQTPGDYYLHVLTVDDEENRGETISSKISVAANYHEHEGSPTTGGGCYTKEIRHTHSSSCYKTCTIIYSGCKTAVEKNDNQIRCTYTITHRNCGEPERESSRWHADDGNSHVNNDSTSTHQYLVCNQGTGITGYDLGCGKDETTVESYTINY